MIIVQPTELLVLIIPLLQKENLITQCDLIMALGKMTWPHLLVRVLLSEQLYRAQQIIAGHPYHKE